MTRKAHLRMQVQQASELLFDGVAISSEFLETLCHVKNSESKRQREKGEGKLSHQLPPRKAQQRNAYEQDCANTAQLCTQNVHKKLLRKTFHAIRKENLRAKHGQDKTLVPHNRPGK